MTTRPCKPDADLKRIWQTLLPGTPFPPCGVAKNADAAAASECATPANNVSRGVIEKSVAGIDFQLSKFKSNKKR